MIVLTGSFGKNIGTTRLSKKKYTYILIKNKLEVGRVWEELREE